MCGTVTTVGGADSKPLDSDRTGAVDVSDKLADSLIIPHNSISVALHA